MISPKSLPFSIKQTHSFVVFSHMNWSSSPAHRHPCTSLIGKLEVLCLFTQSSKSSSLLYSSLGKIPWAYNVYRHSSSLLDSLAPSTVIILAFSRNIVSFQLVNDLIPWFLSISQSIIACRTVNCAGNSPPSDLHVSFFLALYQLHSILERVGEPPTLVRTF